MDSKQNKYSPGEVAKPNKQWPQWLAVLSASLNYFSAGICFSWSSPSLAILLSDDSPFPVTTDEASWIASFLPIGCAVGPVLGAYLSRCLGPKQSTLVSAFPFLTGFVLIIFATGPNWLYISRFASGLAVGFGQTATPIYVAEISENHNRGALMSFFCLWMGAGALFVSCLAPYVSLQTMAEVAAIFPCLLLLSLVFMPDSPYYLMRIGKEEQAIKALKWLRRQKNEEVIQEEVKEIKELAIDNFSFLQCFKSLRDRPNPKALVIVNLTYMAQQFCGAVVVLFYQEHIYSISNVPMKANVAVIISSVVGSAAGLFSVLLVDRWGRKPLLMLSAFGCSLSTGILGTYLFLDQRGFLSTVPNVNWTPIICLNALQIFFSVGLSSIPSTQLGELFSTNVKEICFCGLSVIAALEGFVITKSFQIVEDNYGLASVFWGLSSVTITMMFIMYLVVPETKGKSFLDIQHMLQAKECQLNDVKLQEVSRY